MGTHSADGNGGHSRPAWNQPRSGGCLFRTLAPVLIVLGIWLRLLRPNLTRD